MKSVELNVSLLKQIKERVDSAVKDISQPLESNKVLKSTLGNLGTGAAAHLNKKLTATLDQPNDFTKKAFTWDFKNRVHPKRGITVFSRGRQAAYLQFMFSDDPSRRSRDQKVTEKPTNRQWIPTKLFAPTGDITNDLLPVWKQIMAVASGQRRDPNVFVGTPKGSDKPFGIYGRAIYNGKKVLRPWAFPIQGEAKYALRWDMKTETQKYILDNGEDALRQAIEYRLNKA